MSRKKPALAVIGGSRAYDLLAGGSFGKETKKFKPNTPFGKSAPLRLFKGDGFSYYFLSRHGEKGYELSAPFVNYRANIWALKELGVERIIAWSGPGAINKKFRPGEFAVPSDVIDQTKHRESTFFDGTGLGFIRMNEPFCPEVRKAAIKSVSSAGGALHKKSVYICTEGPRLETPAEIKMFSSWGADLVGMTLVPEAFLAREMEMCYAAVCCVSNYAEGIVRRDFKEGELFEGMLSKSESKKVESAVALLPDIVSSTLKNLCSRARRCNCKDAMARYRKSGRIDDIQKAVKRRSKY